MDLSTPWISVLDVNICAIFPFHLASETNSVKIHVYLSKEVCSFKFPTQSLTAQFLHVKQLPDRQVFLLSTKNELWSRCLYISIGPKSWSNSWSKSPLLQFRLLFQQNCPALETKKGKHHLSAKLDLWLGDEPPLKRLCQRRQTAGEKKTTCPIESPRGYWL